MKRLKLQSHRHFLDISCIKIRAEYFPSHIRFKSFILFYKDAHLFFCLQRSTGWERAPWAIKSILSNHHCSPAILLLRPEPFPLLPLCFSHIQAPSHHAPWCPFCLESLFCSSISCKCPIFKHTFISQSPKDKPPKTQSI